MRGCIYRIGLICPLHQMKNFLARFSSHKYTTQIPAEGSAFAGSVAEQDRKCRGALGADEAAVAQPQLQLDFTHWPG